MPAIDNLNALIGNVTYDPFKLGEARPIPTRILAPLWDAGIISYNDLIEPSASGTPKRLLYSADAFNRKYGNKVGQAQIVALNRLTLLCCELTLLLILPLGIRSLTLLQHQFHKNAEC